METNSIITKKTHINGHDLTPVGGPGSFQFMYSVFHLEIHFLGTVLSCVAYADC